MEASGRRERLGQLLRLAQTYRGWNRKQLAKALGRDTTKLIPESGLPKLDLLMDLAHVLEWGVDEVAQHVWVCAEPQVPAATTGKSFDELERESQAVQRLGDPRTGVQLALAAREIAANPEQRGIAATRAVSGWDRLGQYARSLEAARMGLAESKLSWKRRCILRSNLAGAYYALWQLEESKSIAGDLFQDLRGDAADERWVRATVAYAKYVRGHSGRRLLDHSPVEAFGTAVESREELRESKELYEALARDFSEPAYLAVAATCEGAILELDCFLMERDVADAMTRFSNRLLTTSDASGDSLESLGWWSVFACNVVLRHVDDQRESQRHMAIFTAKADEIASRLNNWSLRERVFSMDWARRKQFSEWTGVATDVTIDSEDVRLIAGTMGRIPAFQRIGWEILDRATIVVEKGKGG